MTAAKTPKVKEPEAPVYPEYDSVIKFPGDVENMPNAPWPYFTVSRDGFYLYKQTLLGPALIRQDYYPDHYETLGDFKKGWFQFTLPRVPAAVISQALDFFRISWREIKSEAEVILLYKIDTQEYDLFVPYQVVSGGKVDSIYDQAHIPEGWEVIGTIHSHCNFSAFHSGIDEADARDFNGLHITIGHVDTDRPSFDAMVMINKQKFQYRLAEAVAETEGALDLLAAPQAWFDNYVFKDPIGILALDFPTLTREELDEFGKRTNPKKWQHSVVKAETPKRTWAGTPPAAGGYNYPITRFSDQFKKTFPVDWFESTVYPSKLKPEHFEVQMNKLLDELFDMCEKSGFFLDAKLFDLSKVETVEAKVIDVDEAEDDVSVLNDGDVISATHLH